MEFKIGNDTFVIEDKMTMKHIRKTWNAFMQIENDPFESSFQILKAVFVSMNGDSDVNKMEERVDEYTMDEASKLIENVMSIVAKQEEDKKK